MNYLNNYINKLKKYGFKYTIKVLIPKKIYYHLNPIGMKISNILFKNISLKNTIVLESHNDFDSNGGAFYNWLIKNEYNKKYRIVWLLWNRKPKNLKLPYNVTCAPLNKFSLRKYYFLCTSKYLLSCHKILGSNRKEQLSIYLTHGPVALKAFKGFTVVPQTLNYCLMPSKYLEPIMADQYGMTYPSSRLKILGYPMHDYLYSSQIGDLHKITHKIYNKVILWMPTFRKNKDGMRDDSYVTEKLGIPIFQNISSYKALNNKLYLENALLIIKIHPMQDMSAIKVKNMSNIIILDAKIVKKLNIDNYRLMKDTDALVSDYSSAAYDYLHLNRPIGYTVDDAKQYKLGFIVNNPQDLMGGQIIENESDFLLFLENVIEDKDPYKDKRHEVFNKVFKYHDGNSSRRLANFLKL